MSALVPKAVVVTCAMAAVVAAAGAAPAAAPAPPKWLTPRDLSEVGADAVIPDVALGPNGDVVVVWAQAKQSTWTVQAVDRPAGGSWGPPHAVSAPADHVASPQVAIVGSRVAAIWERYNGKNLIAQAADRDPKTGAWNVPTSLSPSGRDAQAPRIALDARGDEIAVWASVGPEGWTIQSAYRPARSSWQPSVALGPPQAGTAAPDVVLDPSGNAVAVWASTSGEDGWAVQAAYRGSDGTWSQQSTLSGPDASGSVAPRLGLDPTNGVIAVWSRSLGTSTVAELATRDAATGAWSEASQISPVGSDALTPEIAVNTRGDAAIVWTSSDQSGLGVVATVRHAGKPWGPPAVLASAVSGPLAPEVALDPRGDVLVVWSHAAGSHSRVQAATLPAGRSAWSSARALSKPGEDALTPQLALDAEGDAAAAWARYNGQSFVVQAIGYDASGPALGKLSVPAHGAVGKELTFAVLATDVWSAVRKISWSFGDGTAVSGRLAGHRYARAGRYAVRVTATDSVGHVTSVRRWVTIAAA
jgi:PKD domain